MRKITFMLWLLVATQFASNAQELKHGLGVHFAGLDFYGPQTGDYFRSDKLNRGTLKNEPRFKWDPAIRVSYWYALNKHIDLSAIASVSNLQYPTSDVDSAFIKMKNGTSTFKQEFPYAAFDARVNYNILPKQDFVFAPYVSTGLSYSLFESQSGFDLPIGLGLNIGLSKAIYLNLASEYRMALSKTNQNHLAHSAGLVYWFGGNKTPKIAPPPPPPPAPPVVKIADKDNDGIPDAQDECPTEAGKKELKGCPDRDNDGITDKNDQCPDVKGLAKYLGCPMPDKDMDGFSDEEDRCPDVYSKTNKGCPEIKQEVIEKVAKAAKGVNFASGSSKLLPTSFVNLNNIVSILNEDASLKVNIEGHTDNKGVAAKNLVLSQARADACKAYLISKGIVANRIESIGYGDVKPIGDNNTEAGRAMNRRTEFILKN